MKTHALLTFLGCFLIIACTPTAKKPLWNKEKLRVALLQIIDSAKAEHVGVAMMDMQTGDTLTINGNGHFPMQSVFKLPLSIAVLKDVDNGKHTLTDKIHITKVDMDLFPWSPIKDKYPNADVDLPLSELINYAVSESDNVSCDKLFSLLGGTKPVNSTLHALGIKDISIVATEGEMSKDWAVQYNNWCEPLEMVNLLVKLQQGKLLSSTSTAFLLKSLQATTTGPKRIKGLLPAGTVVFHKTGTGANNEGYVSAMNDAGIVVLPNGKQIAISVFISNTKQKGEVLERIIAKIAKATWIEMLN